MIRLSVVSLQALGALQRLHIVLKTFLLASNKVTVAVSLGSVSSSLVLVECSVDLLEFLIPIYTFTSSSHSVLAGINSCVFLGTMMGLPGSQIFKFKKER